MHRSLALIAIGALLILGVLLLRANLGDSPQEAAVVRVAQFNIWEMSTAKILETDETGAGKNEQLLAATEIITRLRDHKPSRSGLRLRIATKKE